MCIYCGTTKYRKIYENHHGPIPKDESGRTFDIHHIDEDKTNNDPSNLVALSIQDHYTIHESTGNWQACHAIFIRMKKSHEEIAELARKALLTRDNPFAKRVDGSSVSKDRVIDGSHHLLRRSDGTSIASDRVASGTHHLLRRSDGTSLSSDRVSSGIHNFSRREDGSSVSQETVRKRLEEGTHNFVGIDAPSQEEWKCKECGMTGKGRGNYTKSHGDNCRFDSVYRFRHRDTEEEIIMTHGEFCQTFGVPINHFRFMVDRPESSRKGWVIVESVPGRTGTSLHSSEL